MDSFNDCKLHFTSGNEFNFVFFTWSWSSDISIVLLSSFFKRLCILLEDGGITLNVFLRKVFLSNLELSSEMIELEGVSLEREEGLIGDGILVITVEVKVKLFGELNIENGKNESSFGTKVYCVIFIGKGRKIGVVLRDVNFMFL